MMISVFFRGVGKRWGGFFLNWSLSGRIRVSWFQVRKSLSFYPFLQLSRFCYPLQNRSFIFVSWFSAVLQKFSKNLWLVT